MIGPGPSALEHPGFSIRETPASITGNRGELVQRTVSSDFFKNERNQPMFYQHLNEQNHHYREKRVFDRFPFNDFLGIKSDEKIILTKNLGDEEMPMYTYAREDLNKYVEITYRKSGGHDVKFYEFEKASNGDEAGRVTTIVFNSNHEIRAIHDEKRVDNKNLVGRYERHGIRYQQIRKGDTYETRVVRIMDDESERPESAKWKFSERSPKIDSRPEHLQYPDNYLMQNLPPDESFAKIPTELFIDSKV